MAEPSSPAPDPLVRAAAWDRLGAELLAAGRRDRALVALLTALALRDRPGAAEELVEASRAAVRAASGPDVVPLQVDVGGAAGADGPGGAAFRDESRAVWVGAPAPRVLAMLGWVERDGALDVVRLVVPGTRRGRTAADLLLGALPDAVPVTMRVPQRDPALRRACERRGFVEVAGSATSRGHVGGSVRLHRQAA